MPLVNQIEPFVPGTIPFTQFLEQLEWVFTHHKVEDENEKNVSFLVSCSKEVYSELKLLFPGQDLKNVSFKSITDTLKGRYDKAESSLVQRVKFYRRAQGINESAEDFILAVKLQAELCNFGQFTDMAIRDILVCGVKDKDLHSRLLDEEDPSLETVSRMIINREQAGLRARAITGESPKPGILNRLGRQNICQGDRKGSIYSANFKLHEKRLAEKGGQKFVEYLRSASRFGNG